MKTQNKNGYTPTLNFLKRENLVWGYSLVEIMVYLAIFTALSVLVINSFIVILSSFNITNMNRKLLESGVVSMERISREIRQAKNIDIANSSLGSSPGILQLNSTDGSGNSMIIKFIDENGNLYLYKNNTLQGNLLGQNVTITSLIFNRISTTQGEAVKIKVTLQYSGGHKTKSENFYNTVILRGSY